MGTHPIFESDFDCLTERGLKVTKMSGSEEEFDFEAGGSNASLTVPKQCSSLRKSEFVMIKGHACKIVDMSTSKTGKHGHAKVHMVALDIFDGKKYEDICPSTHNMQVPNVQRKEYLVISVEEDGYLTLMDNDTSDTRSDIKAKPELVKEIDALLDNDEDALVTILSAMGREE